VGCGRSAIQACDAGRVKRTMSPAAGKKDRGCAAEEMGAGEGEEDRLTTTVIGEFPRELIAITLPRTPFRDIPTPSGDYSVRNAFMGSIEAAFRAGTPVATSAAIPSTAVTQAKVVGSVGFTA
jgi:hypothetical protein